MQDPQVLIHEKIINVVAHLEAKEEPISSELYTELRELLRDGTLMLDNSLMVSAYRFIERSNNQVYNGDKVMEFDVIQKNYLHQIICNFIWFSCFNSVRLTSLCEILINNNNKEKAGDISIIFKKAIESAELTGNLIHDVLDMANVKLVEPIPLKRIMYPGNNCIDLLYYLEKTYKNVYITVSPTLLPIYQLFTFYNLDADFWGGLCWNILHLMAEYHAIYEDKIKFRKWINFITYDLETFLPCVHCSMHWHQLMSEKYDVIKQCSPHEFPKLMFELHNIVSENIGKINNLMTWKEYTNKIQIGLRNVISKLHEFGD
jgi:Erv1 / Alr family